MWIREKKGTLFIHMQHLMYKIVQEYLTSTGFLIIFQWVSTRNSNGLIPTVAPKPLKSSINLSGHWFLQFTLSAFLTKTPPLPGTLPSLLAWVFKGSWAIIIYRFSWSVASWVAETFLSYCRIRRESFSCFEACCRRSCWNTLF